MNGQSDYEGRVEVYHDGVWGTVCENGWDIEDATVVCRQLGFPYGSIQSQNTAEFGQGTGMIWLDNVTCSELESRLDECSHNEWGNHNCSHNEDVGVICLGEGLFLLLFLVLKVNISLNLGIK